MDDGTVHDRQRERPGDLLTRARTVLMLMACVAAMLVGLTERSRASAVTTTALDRPVVASADDAEESSTGSVPVSSA